MLQTADNISHIDFLLQMCFYILHGRVDLEELSSVRFPVTLPSFSHLLYPRRRRVCSNNKNKKKNEFEFKFEGEMERKKGKGYQFQCSGQFARRPIYQSRNQHNTNRTPWRKGERIYL
ncbi:hypothetical protein V8G54_007816 [Vigna mungo]|uniref:Uncharacterized protein n=1 Tax=Vigna mungo TaxID=3915 RepID=A0AAQ3S9F8_VIGMU